MSVALRGAMSLDDFLAWERAQERPYEFDGLEAVPMNGGSVRHAIIAANIVVVLAKALAGTAFDAFGQGVKIIAAGRVRYPDAVVAPSDAEQDTDILFDPVVVFEVLSPSTHRTDRILKANECGYTPSIRDYVVLEQTRQAGSLFTRSGGAWQEREIGSDAMLGLSALGIEVPLAAFYDRVRFG